MKLWRKAGRKWAGRGFWTLLRISLACLCLLPMGERNSAAAQQPATSSSPATLSVASQARLVGDQKRTRFILDLDRRIDISVTLLAEPARVIVDMPETRFNLSPEAGREGRGLVSGFRFGVIAPGRSRIVLDAAANLTVDKAFVLEPLDGEPARLVVDLVAASRADFLKSVKRSAEAKDAGAKKVASGASSLKSDLPLVVLDPGHGGIDAGAISQDGAAEKNITLEMAKTLRTAIEATGKARVALTRDSDVFISLPDRVRFARERHAVLFLSIHADSSAKPVLGLSGASVYTLSETASDEEAAAYAERENKADQIAGVDLPIDTGEVADILFDLMHRETKNFAVHFARQLVEELKHTVRLVKNPHRFAGFRVLRAPDIPSSLIELGYLTNKDDARLLNSPEWREKAAQYVAKAVTEFLSATQLNRAE